VVAHDKQINQQYLEQIDGGVNEPNAASSKAVQE
jgi:hypothetical protein